MKKERSGITRTGKEGHGLNKALRKSVFAFFVVAVMLCMPLTTIDMAADEESIELTPAGEDYGFKLTLGDITSGGFTGNGIVGVQIKTSNGDIIDLYTESDSSYNNLLYKKSGNSYVENTDASVNPNYRDYLRFDEKTGLGPFNSYYVALNLEHESENDDPYRTSTGIGQIAYILNPYNLKQAIVTGSSTVTGPYTGTTSNVGYYDIPDMSKYNILLFIPTVYWHSDETHLWLSNKQSFFSDEVSPELMIARAHTIDGQIRPYLGIGVYEASELDGTLVSQSGKEPAVSKSIEQFRNMTNKLNEDVIEDTGQYMIWNYYQWTLYKMMSYTVIGTKNAQTAIGMGDTKSQNLRMVTGQGDEQGPYWGGLNSDGSGSYTNGYNSAKLFLENTWGSCHDLLDDVWFADGQLHAGQNSIDVITAHVLNPSTSSTDAGLNDNQALIPNAVLPDTGSDWLKPILTTATNPNYWDFPTTINFASGNVFAPIGDSVQFRSGYQTMCVGGHYGSESTGGLNRFNVRNGFGSGYEDIGTRIVYATYGGTLTYNESSGYKVTSLYGDLSNNYSVFQGVEVIIEPLGGNSIGGVIYNGEALDDSHKITYNGKTCYSFVMPKEDVLIFVIVGNKIPIPSETDGMIANYTYDGRSYTVFDMDTNFCSIVGDNTATDAGEYQITVTPKTGYVWEDGSPDAKTFNWVIQKQTLLIEGSSSAEISKVYDNTNKVADGAVKVSDLFIHGLVHGQVPSISVQSHYIDYSAGSNRSILVTSLVLSDNPDGNFDMDNYEYTFKEFKIKGNKVKINSLNLADNSSSLSITVEPQTYSGEYLTPDPVVKFTHGSTVKTLVKDTDYTVSYTNNLNAGTATIKIAGKGNYSKTVSQTFTISKYKVEWPATVTTPYTGTVISTNYQSNQWYTVVNNASGTAIGTYQAELSIKDPSNAEWATAGGNVRDSLTISDRENDVELILFDGTDNYSWHGTYKSSTGLTLPDLNQASLYSKEGYTVTFDHWYATGGTASQAVTQIPAGSIGSKSFTAVYVETQNTYTVSFSSERPITIDNQTIAYGGKVAKPADPTNDHYEFIGWYKESTFTNVWNFEVDEVKENKILYAKWTPKNFIIKWKNGDTELQSSGVPYGTVPVYSGAVPTKESHVFSGWSPNVSAVTGDQVYVAQFTQNKITVTWYNHDNSVLRLDQIDYDGSTAVVVPSPPEVSIDTDDCKYNPCTWSNVADPTQGIASTTKKNVAYKASFTVKSALVTWKNWDGTTLSSEWVDKGSTPAYDGTPTKPADVQYTYSFSGWSPSIGSVDGPETYTAQYGSTLNKYVVMWVNYDGSIYETSNDVEYGSTPVQPDDNPTRAADAQYTYTFSSWSPAVSAVTGDAVYVALYEKTVNTYTITWLNSEGVKLKEETLNYGETPSYSGMTPIKTKPSNMRYTWVGWEPAVSTVTGNATYTAVFDAYAYDVNITVKVSDDNLKKFGTVKFNGVAITEPTTITVRSNSKLVISDIDVEAVTGETPAGSLSVNGMDQLFEAYADGAETGNIAMFIGWYLDKTNLKDGDKVVDNMTIEAVFVQVPFNYSVIASTYYGGEGQVIFTTDDPSDPGASWAELGIITDIPPGTRITVNADHTLSIGQPGDSFYKLLSYELQNIGYEYEFKGWVYMLSGEPVKTGDRVDDETVIGMVVDKVNQYFDITWKDSDDTVLRVDSLHKGEVPVYSPDPIKQAAGDVFYVFKGWDNTVTKVTGDATYKAQYDEFNNSTQAIITVDLSGGASTVVNTENGWIVRPDGLYLKAFTKDEEQDLDLGTVTLGDSALYRWVNPEGNEVQLGKVVSAYYRAEYMATVTWKNSDDSVLLVQQAVTGSVPNYTGQTPTKADSSVSTYTFDHWIRDGVESNLFLERISGETTYVAAFVPEYKSFTVYFDANNGSDLSFASKSVTYASEYGVLPTVSRADYTFDGWFTSDGDPITSGSIYQTAGDQTLTAHWTYSPAEQEPSEDPVEPVNPPAPRPRPSEPSVPDTPQKEVTKETVNNSDGSVTERITEITEYKDGSKSELINERTEYLDGSTRELIVEKKTDKDGSSVIRSLDRTTEKDGSYNYDVKASYSDRGSVVTHHSGNKASGRISNIIEVEYAYEMSEELIEEVQWAIDSVVNSKQNPNVVIISDSSVSVPKEIILRIILGDGSLTYRENGNELFITAKTMTGIGPYPIDFLCITLTDDVPDRFRADGLTEAYEIRMVIDGQEYHEAFAEPVKVTIPYQLKDGQTPDHIMVYYLGESLEKLQFEYVDGCVVFYLDHMSLYSIVYDEAQSSGSEGSNWFDDNGLYVIIAVVIVLVCAVAFLILRK